MAKKVYRIDVLLPSLPAHLADQSAKAEGGNLRVATGRALAEIFKRSGVKGRRIKSAKINVTLVSVKPA